MSSPSRLAQSFCAVGEERAGLWEAVDGLRAALPRRTWGCGGVKAALCVPEPRGAAVLWRRWLVADQDGEASEDLPHGPVAWGLPAETSAPSSRELPWWAACVFHPSFP